MKEMNEPRTEGFEKLKGRLLSHLVRGSVLEPPEALSGIPGQGLTVAIERLVHEIVLCLLQGDVLAIVPCGDMASKEANRGSKAASCGRVVVGTDCAESFAGN